MHMTAIVCIVGTSRAVKHLLTDVKYAVTSETVIHVHACFAFGSESYSAQFSATLSTGWNILTQPSKLLIRYERDEVKITKLV